MWCSRSTVVGMYKYVVIIALAAILYTGLYLHHALFDRRKDAINVQNTIGRKIHRKSATT